VTTDWGGLLLIVVCWAVWKIGKWIDSPYTYYVEVEEKIEEPVKKYKKTIEIVDKEEK
jgi:hypothetical protein